MLPRFIAIIAISCRLRASFAAMPARCHVYDYFDACLSVFAYFITLPLIFCYDITRLLPPRHYYAVAARRQMRFDTPPLLPPFFAADAAATCCFDAYFDAAMRIYITSAASLRSLIFAAAAAYLFATLLLLSFSLPLMPLIYVTFAMLRFQVYVTPPPCHTAEGAAILFRCCFFRY